MDDILLTTYAKYQLISVPNGRLQESALWNGKSTPRYGDMSFLAYN